jgi:folate-binding protein YgfZ
MICGMPDAVSNLSLIVPADAHRTFLRVAGEDAIQLLDGLITQDVAGMPDAHASFGMFLTAKARIMSPALVYRATQDEVLLELPYIHRDAILTHLRRYRLRARVELDAVEAGRVLVAGPKTADTRGAGWFVSNELHVPGAQKSHDVQAFVGSLEECEAMFTTLANGVRPADAAFAFTTARLELGIPGFAEFVEDYMPAEVGADEVAVSFTKGCYLGQEPVARLHWRGHANRTLRQLDLHDIPSADTHAPIELAPAEGASRTAGIVTSWTPHPRGTVRALGIVRRDVPRGAELRSIDGAITITVRDDAPVPHASR